MAIELFGLSTFSFASVSTGRCQYYFERKRKALNMDEELRLSLPAQETSSVPI